MDVNTYFLNQKLKQEDTYLSWIENNEETLLEAYIESLEFENVPDDFIQNQFEASL